MKKRLLFVAIGIFFCINSVGCATKTNTENENFLVEKEIYYLQNELKNTWENFLSEAKKIQSFQKMK